MNIFCLGGCIFLIEVVRVSVCAEPQLFVFVMENWVSKLIAAFSW